MESERRSGAEARNRSGGARGRVRTPEARVSSRPVSGFDHHDAQQFRTGLIGYYLTMTAFGVAAAVAACCWMFAAVLPATIATVAAVVSGAFSWHYLRISRGEVGAGTPDGHP